MNDDVFDKFGEKEFIEFVKEKIATEKLFGPKAKEVQKKIIKFYLGNSKGKDSKFYKFQYAKVGS